MKGYKMANVLVTSDWYIKSVQFEKNPADGDAGRYYVTYQRLPESTYTVPTYLMVETSNTQFPENLGKAEFCANVTPHINNQCSKIDTSIANRVQLYQD